ncbi:DUF3857 domain-containing protein [Flavobacterium aquiphilum]|uniref:DUF3857 domain-containing protein n=1 Tax=Flavobacterium aquiphilum TaxID=3003261 RepID=UPI00248192D2|nr:DUF3857 domain-containing protein [Flavobacterium aquiphilum]
MRLHRMIIIVVLTLSFVKANAQELSLGKVSIAELEQKAHPKDSSATAAILYKRGKVRIEYDKNDGFVTLTEVETRIKIYKKEGLDWANQNVWYYNGSNLSEKVVFSDAFTYNLVNGKIEKTKLKSEGIFDEVVNKYRSQKKIAMPNVKEGSVIEFKYIIKTPNPTIIREWDFQEKIPVNYSQFITFVPEYLTFTTRQKGFIFPRIMVEKNSNSTTVSVEENREMTRNHTSNYFYKTDQVINYTETKTTYLGENFPAIKEEEFVNNINNYISSVQHELSTMQFPNSSLKEYSTSWSTVVKTIYEDDDFGSELNKTGYFEEDLKKIIMGTNTPEEKIQTIFNYVKTNMKWNNYTGYSCENGVRKAYKEKIGNTADINLMLTAMLRYSGLTANPVLVSTRSNGIALFPNRTAFNYVISAVETPNGNILLDATDKFSVPNVLPIRALNWYGRLIRNDGTSEEVELMPKKPSSNIVLMNCNIEADGKITGKAKRLCSDYSAMVFRKNISEQKEDIYLEKLENKNNKIEISEYSRDNEKEMQLPASETYSFTGANLCERIEGKIYLNPMLFFASNKNPFNQEKREYPVDFGFPFLDKYNITLKIPDGFAVESLPAPVTLNMEDNLGNFKFNIVVDENTIQMSVLHQINKAIVLTDQYDMLKEYYKAMIAKETEKIVLKKI